tara:strand:+ start:1848 stop:2798 length:951 start_codon:yes stop_codon:yes gene_type:complete
MKKKILITGGAGFIGFNLYKKLYKNNILYILDYKREIKKKKFYKNCRFIYGDISNKKTFKKILAKKIIFDDIYHFAAETSTYLCENNPNKCFKSNVIGTWNLYNYCQILKPKNLIFSSSMAVYGKNAISPREKDKCKPISNYGLSKLVCEKILSKLLELKINVKIFRIFNAYGIYQNYNNKFQGMLSIYLAQIVRSSKVHVTGSLKRARDFIYIEDILTAITNKKIVKSKKNHIFNLGSGKKTYVFFLINKLFKMSNKKKNIVKMKSHKGDSFVSYANNSLLKKLGWKNKISLTVGIKKVIKDIKKFDEYNGNFNW